MQGHSQINIKIAYKTGLPDFAVNNRLLSMYQPSAGEVQQPLSDLSFIHGIQLGVRQKVSNWGWEVGWENLSRDRSALTFHSDSETFGDRTYNYGIGGFYAGIENHFGSVALGAEIHRRKLSIDRDINGNDLAIVSQTVTSLEFHLLWVVQQSDFVSFGIKPYFQLATDPYDLTKLAIDLDIGGDQGPFDESLKTFGLSFVFYNGRQD